MKYFEIIVMGRVNTRVKRNRIILGKYHLISDPTKWRIRRSFNRRKKEIHNQVKSSLLVNTDKL